MLQTRNDIIWATAAADLGDDREEVWHHGWRRCPWLVRRRRSPAGRRREGEENGGSRSGECSNRFGINGASLAMGGRRFGSDEIVRADIPFRRDESKYSVEQVGVIATDEFYNSELNAVSYSDLIAVKKMILYSNG
ncbi:hypothetical protein CQW23_23882 [Capsicum baccatum]|uniref:Uncharacterized protein n=1 Tax=Capsicum baccatum TaxID=33114 RepID=A0A2G2VT98_CAPBA|nr:hypothetical protein CQW23_23882 [Capsicum baccatum]